MKTATQTAAPRRECSLVRVIAALMTEPWCITPRMHKTLTEIAVAHAFGGEAEAAQHVLAESFAPTMRTKMNGNEVPIVDGVAVITAAGVLGRRFSMFLNDSGVTSLDVLRNMIDTARRSADVRALVLVVDSPGGTAMGVREVGQAMREMRAAGKPVVAYVDGMAASGGYWIASQADAVYASPSALVGSIGAYIAILDETRAMEMEGLKTELFKSGRYKAAGVPGIPLNDEQRAMLQGLVDTIAEQFRADVQAMRRTMKRDDMEAQDFLVDEAIAKGYVDNIATVDDAIRDAGNLQKQRGNSKGK